MGKLTKEEIKVSKHLSYILRHNPSSIGIKLDSEGRVNFEDLVKKYNEYNKTNLTIEDFLSIFGKEDKKRYEVKDGYIRAYYGHSTGTVTKKESIPPKLLYHGTSHKAYSLILEEGLKPMQRDYVHLTTDLEMAYEVGKRYDKEPVILVIDTEIALERGSKFYKEPNGVWLADKIKEDSLFLS